MQKRMELKDLWDTTEPINMRRMGAPQADRERGAEILFEDMLAEIFSRLMNLENSKSEVPHQREGILSNTAGCFSSETMKRRP